MSNHLSHEQFARCFVARSDSPELRHIQECPECSAAFERFDDAIAAFRSAIRGRIDAQVATQTPDPLKPSVRQAGGIAPKRRWAWAAAVVILLALFPLLSSERKSEEGLETPSVATSPDALMDAINVHLSRTVPAPMEPMMLLPNEPFINESGGIQ
jgi:anti-sigma factor RsiW